MDFSVWQVRIAVVNGVALFLRTKLHWRTLFKFHFSMKSFLLPSLDGCAGFPFEALCLRSWPFLLSIMFSLSLMVLVSTTGFWVLNYYLLNLESVIFRIQMTISISRTLSVGGQVQNLFPMHVILGRLVSDIAVAEVRFVVAFFSSLWSLNANWLLFIRWYPAFQTGAYYASYYLFYIFMISNYKFSSFLFQTNSSLVYIASVELAS